MNKFENGSPTRPLVITRVPPVIMKLPPIAVAPVFVPLKTSLPEPVLFIVKFPLVWVPINRPAKFMSPAA